MFMINVFVMYSIPTILAVVVTVIIVIIKQSVLVNSAAAWPQDLLKKSWVEETNAKGKPQYRPWNRLERVPNP